MAEQLKELDEQVLPPA